MIEKIRNIAIIAHVDHGKTTLIDKLLQEVTSKRDFEKMDTRAMDSNELEKERGITILSKNTTIYYNDHKINIVDTPGHADFGGEVERVLNMVDAVLLLVDAFEGPMPQTKYVLNKAMSMGLKTIVVMNKIDRPHTEPDRVLDDIYDLFIDLGADDEQLEFPVIYASAKEGFVRKEADSENLPMSVLLDLIIDEIAPPKGDKNKDLLLQVSTLDYDSYVGLTATGRILNGEMKVNQTLEAVYKDKTFQFKVTKLIAYNGLSKIDVQSAAAGDIVTFSGSNSFKVGMSIGEINKTKPLKLIEIDQPTISMYFMVNNSPFAGNEGKFLTSRQIKERLDKEILSNVALKVEETNTTESFKVSGRGELHLSILIETMRREGYELQISRPEVIFKKDENGKVTEPYELLYIEVPEPSSGIVIQKLNQRFGLLQSMELMSSGNMKIVYKIPSRGLLGYRSQFLTDTKGEGILYSVFDSYDKLTGDVKGRNQGSIISQSQGKANAYALFNLQDRGQFFIHPNEEVYEGMIIGTSAKGVDVIANPTKAKKLTNVRASGSDEAIKLSPPVKMSLEQSIDFINDDELVEITPTKIRIRKKILSEVERRRASRTTKNTI